MGKSTTGTAEAAGESGAAGAGSQSGAEKHVVGLSFEQALDQLESTVSRLEEGEMPLEEALDLFEQGVALSKRCGKTLDEAERRIEILVADRDDSLETAPLDEDESWDGEAEGDEDLEDGDLEDEDAEA